MPNDPYVPDVSPVSGIPAQQTYFLGRYRIIDEIGLGGMASVHLARVDGLGGFQRWFAIKRIHAHLVEDETFVNMFLDEANVAARISHPNVATVFELGRHDDTYWIAMEYLHGEPLREVMRRTEEMGATMPPEIACRVIAEAADGLHAAHELQGKDGEKLNLIHRDVTPHNLFVTYEGVTKVVDFGIAKFQDRMASTQAGTLKGKLAYMSPEQVQGESIDRRTDIFALGVVLWELTTGQRLFRMDSDLDTLAKVQECNIPPPSTMVRGYPLDLEKILMQALAKNREERFSTAREFSRALQSLLTRRGLFIANDEVAAYMGSIFVDRIAKREEHLRWASAVSDAAAAAANAAPAAQPARTTTASRAAPLPPARPTPAPPPARTSAPVSSKGAAPRPAAGAPARPPPYGGPPVSMTASQQNARPQAAPPAPRGSTFPPPPPRGNTSYPLPGLPRAVAPPPPVEEDDEDRTVQATAAQQAAAHAAYENDDYDDDGDATIVSRTAPSDTVPPSQGFAPAPILPAAGAPARPQPYAPPGQQPGAGPSRGQGVGQRTMPLTGAALNAPVRPIPPLQQPRTQMGLQSPGAPPPQQQQAFPGGLPPGFNITDPSLPVQGAPQPSRQPQMAPQQMGQQQMQHQQMQQMQPPQQPWGAPPPAYGPPPQMGAPYAPPPLAPQYPQNNGYPPPPAPFGAPGYPPPQSPFAANATPAVDPKNTQGINRPKRIPAWAVAVASGLIAMVLLGGVLLIFVFARTPRGPSGTARPQGSTMASQPGTAGSSGAPGGKPGGVFAAARAGFLAAATPPPLTTNTPDPTPTTGATPPPPPPAAVAAADPTPPTPAAAVPPPPVAAVAADPTPPPQPVVRNDPPPPPPTRYPSNAQAVSPAPPAPMPLAASGGGGSSHGFLSVICLPGCDKVEVDGQSFGASPIFKKQVPVGSHKIKLVSSNPPGTKVVSKIVIADSVAMVRESMP